MDDLLIVNGQPHHLHSYELSWIFAWSCTMYYEENDSIKTIYVKFSQVSKVKYINSCFKRIDKMGVF